MGDKFTLRVNQQSLAHVYMYLNMQFKYNLES